MKTYIYLLKIVDTLCYDVICLVLLNENNL